MILCSDYEDIDDNDDLLPPPPPSSIEDDIHPTPRQINSQRRRISAKPPPPPPPPESEDPPNPRPLPPQTILRMDAATFPETPAAGETIQTPPSKRQIFLLFYIIITEIVTIASLTLTIFLEPFLMTIPACNC